ncbi:hypothetical protein [Alicyclobacillus shizuokensis]|uniref:hypothetical protein n=1 Tax=Alicyclobacillus shizuokensis TaxID=392014 RepID=UPI00082D3D3C|nr:hypothetical protein [Alicyclobacillus shizuokensis]
MRVTRIRRRRPTKHYDERVLPIDEQLCALIARRKAVAGGNPGFPPLEQIDCWAGQFGLSEHRLDSVFHTLYNEDLYQHRVEPSRYLRAVPVMRWAEQDGQVFLVTHLRQYENASVVYFQIDNKSESNIDQGGPRRHHFVHWELSVGPGYECYMESGSGDEQQFVHRFVVSPALPDDVSSIPFTFTWTPRWSEEDSESEGGTVVLT